MTLNSFITNPNPEDKSEVKWSFHGIVWGIVRVCEESGEEVIGNHVDLPVDNFQGPISAFTTSMSN
jgi:hypothetical protein